MNDWTAGYVADVGYTYGYYSELNPARIQVAFLNAGLAPPKIGAACELGFGQGLSANVHAAASITTWHGTDFNPSQAGFAQELAEDCDSGAHLVDQAFDTFCMRDDLPDFDFIALHGIWSWISDENREVIVDFLRRKLKVGGVLYISYNTLPGWAGFAPMRHLMTEHAARFGTNGQGIVHQINGALDFGSQMFALDAKYTKATLGARERFEKLKEQDRHYLAHEYFNQDWLPMYFSDMVKWLAPAKLDFACSANYLDAVDVINLSEEQQSHLAGIPDPNFKQTVRDFLVNQQFRKDYWVRGSRQISALDRNEALRECRVILTMAVDAVPTKVAGALLEATLQDSIYQPILEVMRDHRPHSIGQIESAVAEKGVNFVQLVQALVILIGVGSVALTPDVEGSSKCKEQVSRLNSKLMRTARSSNEMRYLASPLTGGAVTVPRMQQLFLLAMHNGQKKPEDLAKWVWQVLSAQGQSLIKEGKPIQDPEENQVELVRQARAFEEEVLPILKSLQIA